MTIARRRDVRTNPSEKAIAVDDEVRPIRAPSYPFGSPAAIRQFLSTLVEIGRWHTTESRLQCYAAAWALCIAASNRLQIAFTLDMTADQKLGLVARFVYSFALTWVLFTLLHASFCVWNDVVDRDIDAKVRRTCHRPLPTGRISVPTAVAWFIVKAAFTAWLSIVFLGYEAFWHSFPIYIIYTIYPFAKRFFVWPQLVLCTAVAWPAFTGWVVGWNLLAPSGATDIWLSRAAEWLAWLMPQAFHYLPNVLNEARFAELSNTLVAAAAGAPMPILPVIPLALTTGIWAIYFDTAYGFQDAQDDKKLNINSTAVFFTENHIKTLLGSLVSAVVVLFGLTIFLVQTDFFSSAPSRLVSINIDAPWTPSKVLSFANGVVLASIPVYWALSFASQLRRFDKNDPRTGGVVFAANVSLGMRTVGICFFGVFCLFLGAFL